MSRQTIVAQTDLRRTLSNYQFFVTQIRRGVIFLIAFTGLIGAACVNGIPSINCFALADAYTLALGNLGALFLIELCMIVVMIGVESKSKEVNIHTIRTWRYRIGLSVAFLLSAFLFFAIMQTTTHGVTNIKVASAHCLEDTPQQKHNSNDRIPLLRNLLNDKATL